MSHYYGHFCYNIYMKKLIYTISILIFGFVPAYALAETETTVTVQAISMRTLTSLEVSSVTKNTAVIKIPDNVLNSMDEYDRQNTYIEYFKTNQVCIAIYPTPEYCLPKKFAKGLSKVTLDNLDPNTSYTAVYKRDNSIVCITNPCPENSFRSGELIFNTKTEDGTSVESKPMYLISKNIWYKSKNDDVQILQNFLYEKGFLKVKPTSYFGTLTLRAVKDFQKSVGIINTGYVGALTRSAIEENSKVKVMPGTVEEVTVFGNNEEKFVGKIETYSIGCFADGECSVTVGGKKIVTTIGWTLGDVGSVIGVESFGEIFNAIGKEAEVFARKVDNKNYTLYGNTGYYVKVK